MGFYETNADRGKTPRQPNSASKASIEESSEELTRWVFQDCYKASLAVVHADVLLWHIRRHSMESFYEPSAVFLATMCF